MLGIVFVAAGLGGFAVWFQWGQTRRCLAYFGPAAAGRIQSAERVELWGLVADGETIRVGERLDVSQAPGLVHLRRGLIEDVNYAWESGGGGPASAGGGDRLPAEAWDFALAFLPDPQGKSTGATNGPAESARPTVLAIDLDGDGSLTVVGQPGRISLGRLAPGLRTWVRDTRRRAGQPGKTGL